MLAFLLFGRLRHLLADLPEGCRDVVGRNVRRLIGRGLDLTWTGVDLLVPVGQLLVEADA